MTNFKTVIKIATGAMSIAALTACGGTTTNAGGGGGGGGGGGSTSVSSQLSAFDTAFSNATSGIAPTSNMPTSGSATYAGELQIDVIDDMGAGIGEVLGDTEIMVAFGQPTASNTSATVDKIRGVDNAGTEVTSSGSLSSEYWET